MSSTRMLRTAGVIALSVALVGSAAAQAAPKKRKNPKPGPNLVVNAGFEDSALEGPGAPPGSLAQPVLPTGWSFEGLTLLFDHTPNAFYSGKRAAGISGSLSGNDKICPTPTTCQANPTKGVKGQLAPRYTLAPHWRTANAIPVKPGTEYVLSTWVKWVVVTVDEGASMKVRWVKADGSPISEDIQLKRSTAENNLDLPWAKQTFKVKAPADAAGAVVLLGQTDDNSFGQVVYDEVHFGTA